MIHSGDFIKLKQGKNPAHYGLDANKIYVSQGWGKGESVKLYNSKGKLRQYPDNLFDKIEKSFPEDIGLSQEIKELKAMWLKDDSPESKEAWKILQEKDKEWQERNPIRLGMKVKFKKGTEAGRYGSRIFKIIKIQQGGIFEKLVKLDGLYGFFRLSSLEVQNE